jgi:hypothetical protein
MKSATWLRTFRPKLKAAINAENDRPTILQLSLAMDGDEVKAWAKLQGLIIEMRRLAAETADHASGMSLPSCRRCH